MSRGLIYKIFPRQNSHIIWMINQFLDAGVDPKEIPLPHEFILNHDLLAQLYPSFAEGATPFFIHLELVQICGIS